MGGSSTTTPWCETWAQTLIPSMNLDSRRTCFSTSWIRRTWGSDARLDVFDPLWANCLVVFFCCEIRLPAQLLCGCFSFSFCCSLCSCAALLQEQADGGRMKEGSAPAGYWCSLR